MVIELPDLSGLQPAKSAVSDVGPREPHLPGLRVVPHETTVPESESLSSTRHSLPRLKDPLTQRWPMLSESTIYSRQYIPVNEPSQSSVQRWLIGPEDETHPVSCGSVMAAILDCGGGIIW